MKSAENILRSLFISLFPLAALLILVHAIQHYLENGFSWQFVGIVIMAIAIIVFFVGIFIKPRARTDAHLKVYSSFIATGFIIAVFAVLLWEPFNLRQVSVSLLLAVGWLLYLKWYAIFKNRKNEILVVGKKLPEFGLENSEKKRISSTSFLGKPSIYIFYRGNWCPFCMAQIKEIALQYGELEKMGVNTIFISPQPHSHTKSLAAKFNLNFRFLVDHKNKVANQLGILAAYGIPAGFQIFGYDSDTVMPTVVITDGTGKIIYVDLTDNYRVRPEPKLFLKVIKESLALPYE